mgnify:CR=1 FL=1
MASDLDITFHSARDLKNVNWKHGELCAYAVAWIDDNDQTKASTRVDSSGDTDPKWEEKLTIPVNKSQLQDARLVVAIYHEKPENPLKPEKAKVGSVSVPLMEVVDAGGFEETLDYNLKLKRPSGRPHGKIEFSVRLKEKRYVAAPPPPAYKSADESSRAYQGYPPQPYAQPGYPYSAQPVNYGYGQQPPQYGYGQQAPQYGYGQQAPQYGYDQQTPQYSYGQQPPYNASSTSYGAPPPPSGYYSQDPPPSQGSKYGGLATGLAVGALAGGVGALALDAYVDHEENEAAEEQAEEDALRYSGQDDYSYDGGDDF